MGAIPVAVPVAAAAAEAGWAWYDPDFFLAVWKDADLERRVAMLNNYWQSLHRSALASKLSSSSKAMQKLDADMAAWWAWKKDFAGAVLRRAIPFGSSRWEDELDEYWFAVFHKDVELVAAAAGEQLRQELAERGVDPARVEPEVSVIDELARVSMRAADATADASRSAIFWPMAAAAVFALGSVWLIARARA